jgi:lipoprotein NlpI
MVEGYVYTALIWEDSGEVERANEVYKLTTQLYPRTDVINVLGKRAAAARHYDEALHWWKMSLQLDPAQKNIMDRVVALQSQLNGK